MPIKDGVIAYEFINEFLNLMKTEKDNNDEAFRKKSEWLKKEDLKLYNYSMIAFLDAKKRQISNNRQRTAILHCRNN